MKKKMSALDQEIYYEMCKVINRCITFRSVVDVVLLKGKDVTIRDVKKLSLILTDEQALRIFEIAQATNKEKEGLKTIDL
jgi:hypothetical protein